MDTEVASQRPRCHRRPLQRYTCIHRHALIWPESPQPLCAPKCFLFRDTWSYYAFYFSGGLTSWWTKPPNWISVVHRECEELLNCKIYFGAYTWLICITALVFWECRPILPAFLLHEEHFSLRGFDSNMHWFSLSINILGSTQSERRTNFSKYTVLVVDLRNESEIICY